MHSVFIAKKDGYSKVLIGFPLSLMHPIVSASIANLSTFPSNHESELPNLP